jgi:hypothetical protein
LKTKGFGGSPKVIKQPILNHHIVRIKLRDSVETPTVRVDGMIHSSWTLFFFEMVVRGGSRQGTVCQERLIVLSVHATS